MYFYDYTDEVSSVSTSVNSISDKVYKVNTKDGFNSNYVGEETNKDASNIEDLKILINQIYEGTESLELPTMMTLELDLEQDWIVEPFTGLENGDSLEYAVASETETVTYPYSLSGTEHFRFHR